ncbi:MAG TPA: hypothetical protein VJS15_02330 [Allosphingosinicella sp.]|nr:hypothetical protein [Allosphingosinicella sp.]
MDSDPNQVTPTDFLIETSIMSAPLTYVDSLYHLLWADGVAKLTFVQTLADPPPDANTPMQNRARHVVTLAMPVPNLVRAIDYLNANLPLLTAEKPDG